MAVRLRTPEGGGPRRRDVDISEEAIRLYARGKQLWRKHGNDTTPEYVQIWNELHAMLQLRPWVPSPIEVDPNDPPDHPNRIDSWELSCRARRELERVLHERRKAERAARRAKTLSSSPEPSAAPTLNAAGRSQD